MQVFVLRILVSVLYQQVHWAEQTVSWVQETNVPLGGWTEGRGGGESRPFRNYLRGRMIELVDGSNGVRERKKDDTQTSYLKSRTDGVLHLLRCRTWEQQA